MKLLEQQIDKIQAETKKGNLQFLFFVWFLIYGIQFVFFIFVCVKSGALDLKNEAKRKKKKG